MVESRKKLKEILLLVEASADSYERRGGGEEVTMDAEECSPLQSARSCRFLRHLHTCQW